MTVTSLSREIEKIWLLGGFVADKTRPQTLSRPPELNPSVEATSSVLEQIWCSNLYYFLYLFSAFFIPSIPFNYFLFLFLYFFVLFSLKLFILACKEYLSADKANIIRWHQNELLPESYADPTMHYFKYLLLTKKWTIVARTVNYFPGHWLFVPSYLLYVYIDPFRDRLLGHRYLAWVTAPSFFQRPTFYHIDTWSEREWRRFTK